MGAACNENWFIGLKDKIVDEVFQMKKGTPGRLDPPP